MSTKISFFTRTLPKLGPLISRVTPAKLLVTNSENISGKTIEIKLDSHKLILQAGRGEKKKN